MIFILKQVGTLIPKIDLSSYCIKADIDTLFPNIDLGNYYTKSEGDDIDNGLPTLILNTYTKPEVDNLLYTNYPSLSFIVNNFHSKTETDSALSDYTTSGQLHIGFL